MPDLLHLIGLGLFAPGLQVQDFLDTLFEEDVMTSAYSLLIEGPRLSPGRGQAPSDPKPLIGPPAVPLRRKNAKGPQTKGGGLRYLLLARLRMTSRRRSGIRNGEALGAGVPAAEHRMLPGACATMSTRAKRGIWFSLRRVKKFAPWCYSGDMQFRSRKLVASLLLCLLAIASASSSLCRGCSEIDQSSQRNAVLQSPDGQDSAPDCDRDGCSCCGFQFVLTFPRTGLAHFQSATAPELPRALPPAEPVFTLDHPPRG